MLFKERMGEEEGPEINIRQEKMEQKLEIFQKTNQMHQSEIRGTYGFRLVLQA